jgi:GT2 family glycosyltransferase
VFTDDDIVLPPMWLHGLCRTLIDYEADGAGGPVTPRWIGPRPAWLGEPLLRQLGVADHGPIPFLVTTPKHPLIGGNCAYRRRLFAEHGGFSITDPAEDCEWFLRMLRAGRRLAYQPTAGVWHTIQAAALSPRTVSRRLFRQGRGHAMRAGFAERPGRRVCRIPLWVLREYAALYVAGAAYALRGRVHEALWCWFQRDLYHGLMAQCLRDWARARLRRGRFAPGFIR